MLQFYVPINCEFHDVLEATATCGRIATIRFLDQERREKITKAAIADLYVKESIEYMKLEDGNTIRLDHIISVDSHKRSDFVEASCVPH